MTGYKQSIDHHTDYCTDQLLTITLTMHLTWRENLFNSKSTLLNLGFPLSSQASQKILGVCFRTLQRWDKTASAIPEHKLSRIRMANRAAEWGGITPFLPYQVWVIGKVGEIYVSLPNGYPKKAMALVYLKAKAEEFTREEYLKEQQRFAELALVTKE